MQDADLLVSLAGIAGVFVGFGALISVRSGGPSDAHEVAYIRWVVSIGIWVVIAALAPVIVSRYDIAGHDLWLACSLLALVLFAVMLTVNGRSPEMRGGPCCRPCRRATGDGGGEARSPMWLPTASLVVALALVVLGLVPGPGAGALPHGGRARPVLGRHHACSPGLLAATPADGV